MSDVRVFILGLAVMSLLGSVVAYRRRSTLILSFEEELLGRLYGSAYEGYRRRTRRYFGRCREAG